jgi:peptide-methionine (S)-S-oxide reductase
MSEKKDTAIFAGGCFWCTTKSFDELPGIYSLTSGYTGGHTENPTYEEVLTHTTGHTEATKIEFNPDVISYDDLVNFYWGVTDPTDAFGQFQDRGDNYRPVIFVNSEEQRQIAEASKDKLQNSGLYDEPIVTSIEDAVTFYPAEEYHQNFHKKNPERMKLEELGREKYLSKK